VIPGASRVIRRELSCSPCYQRECPLRHHACMTDVGVDEVFQAAVGLFAEVDGRLVAERRAKSGL
jgi:ADP-heptose:LPS heptosyltransferase